jgi:hypothetical protein
MSVLQNGLRSGEQTDMVFQNYAGLRARDRDARLLFNPKPLNV